MDIEKIGKLVDDKKQLFIKVSDEIWDASEVRFNLKKSADALIKALEEEGFTIQRGVAEMDDAFIATYGEGKPVIGLLGEYDALDGLSQKADVNVKDPRIQGAPGHGCGHNLLGAGTLAGAIAVKDYMKQTGLKGTVVYFGCPAEEGGSGKTFMARAGLFKNVDAFLSYHPMAFTRSMAISTLANYHIIFKFKGRPAHAAAAPEMGRSALDALELMSVGVNYLREHIIQEARVHYAYLNAGGKAPNVVQSEAEVRYLIRAPRLNQVESIFQRIVDIAKGAALMTGTQMEMEWESSVANIIPNDVMGRLAQKYLCAYGPYELNEEEKAYAKKLQESIGEAELKRTYNQLLAQFGSQNVSKVEEMVKKPVVTDIMPYSFQETAMPGSSDVGDASWFAPTIMFTTACFPTGTVEHSWQWVSAGKSSMAHNGMLYGGKVMAAAAIELMENAELLNAAKEENKKRMGNETYFSPMPDTVKPI